jgi:hypothetical protein
VDLLLGNDAEHGRLLQLDNETLAKAFIEDGISCVISEAIHHDGELFEWSVRAAAQEKGCYYSDQQKQGRGRQKKL